MVTNNLNNNGQKRRILCEGIHTESVFWYNHFDRLISSKENNPLIEKLNATKKL